MTDTLAVGLLLDVAGWILLLAAWRAKQTAPTDPGTIWLYVAAICAFLAAGVVVWL